MKRKQKKPLSDNIVDNPRLSWILRSRIQPECGPGSIPGLSVICGLSLLLVLIPAPRVFFPRILRVFLLPQKPTFLNFDLNACNDIFQTGSKELFDTSTYHVGITLLRFLIIDQFLKK